MQLLLPPHQQLVLHVRLLREPRLLLVQPPHLLHVGLLLPQQPQLGPRVRNPALVKTLLEPAFLTGAGVGVPIGVVGEGRGVCEVVEGAEGGVGDVEVGVLLVDAGEEGAVAGVVVLEDLLMFVEDVDPLAFALLVEFAQASVVVLLELVHFLVGAVVVLGGVQEGLEFLAVADEFLVLVLLLAEAEFEPAWGRGYLAISL